MRTLKGRVGGIRHLEIAKAGELRLSAGEMLAVELRSGGHWYGHGFSHVQPYPLETGEVVNAGFAVNNIQSPVWMCSAGYVLAAETVAPLAVRINSGGDGLLELSCPGEPLTVRVYQGVDLPAANGEWLRGVGWPNRPPEASRFGDSLFCTWTQYPRCITQERVLDMARQIRAKGYPCTTLLIDDRWESRFGELSFASRDFPDPRAMFAELRRLGFEAWLWVTPFVSVEVPGFERLSRDRVLVPSRTGNGAARLKWWGGTAGLVDITAPQGRAWYRGRLQALLELGAEGFKIDGGDHKYHPALNECGWHRDPGASGYTDVLLGIFEELTPNRCETRTAWQSQRRSILWREGGKDSHWGLDNGLQAMVSLGQHLGLLGYDLLMPDMVPGRVQTVNSEHPLPSDELMVRWTEASAFFPFIQFSYFPWNYAPQVAEAVLGFARVHKSLEPYLASQANSRRTPLFRPVWYDWPKEASLYTMGDQFMLGSDLLVAPVLEEGAITRDVCLPTGIWVDAWSGERVSGQLRAWPAPCPGIPVFVRADPWDSFRALRETLRLIRRGSVTTELCSACWRAGLDRELGVTG